MKNKRMLLSFLTIGITFFALLTFVSAQEDFKGVFIDKISEILAKAFGGDTAYNYVANILSPQILFGLLVFLLYLLL